MNTIAEHINSAGFSFVEFALPMLVQSGVLIVILLLADLLLRKKVKAVFRYWIWMLVLVKLVLPTSLSSPLSLGYLFGDKLTYQDLAQSSPTLEPTVPAPADISPGIDPLFIQPNPYIPPTEPVISVFEPMIAEPVSPPEVPVTPLSWQGVVFLVWLAVVIAMGLLLLQRAFFVRGLVAQSKEAGRLMNDELAYCCASMGIKCKVGLKVSVNATTPSVCGLIRPVILVPWNLASTLGASRLRTVLMHELAHIKRADLWVNLAQTVLQIIYFYNPLLWLANCVIRRIREQAVDEAVLVAMGEKAQRYPQMLVDVAKMAFKRPALSLRLIGVVESKSALAGRIKHILGRPMPKTAKLGILGLLAIFIIAAILLPMAKSAISSPRLVIKGIVKDARTGELIAGARVFDDGYGPTPAWDEIRPNERYEGGAITNSAGEYSFLTWPEHHTIRAQAPGYKAKTKSLYDGHFTINKKDQEVFDFALEADPRDPRLSKLTAKEILKSFMAAALSGAEQKVGQLVTSSMTAGKIKDFQKIKSVEDLKIDRVYYASGKYALAATSKVKISWARERIFFFRLERRDTGWWIYDMAFNKYGWWIYDMAFNKLGQYDRQIERFYTIYGDLPAENENPPSKLAFQVVPNIDSGRQPDLTRQQLEQYSRDLQANGPAAVNSQYRWMPAKQELKGDLPLSTYQGRQYILLCSQSPYVMNPADGWALTKVYTALDNMDRPMVGISFDRNGGEFFYYLTRENLQNSLAIVIDDQVNSTPKIQTPVRAHAIITGSFSESEAEKTAIALQQGMSPGKSHLQPGTEKAPQSQFSTTLPNGVTVELVGVCEHPSEGKKWWKPDGDELLEAPYDEIGGNVYPDGDEKSFEFAIRLGNLTAEHVNTKVGCEESVGGSAGGSSSPQKNGEYLSDFRWLATTFPKKLKACTVKVGVAAGQWQPVAESNGKGFGSRGSELGGVSFTKAFEVEDGISITVADDILGRPCRVVAITNDGEVVKPVRSSGSSAGKARQTTAKFNNISLSDIKEFQFQTRPYEWVEFKNVSLKPNFKPDVLVEGEGVWGEAVEGVQMRVHPERQTWYESETPKFIVDMRNKGIVELELVLAQEAWEVELDGLWYRAGAMYTGDVPIMPLGPREEQNDILFYPGVWSSWNINGKPLKFTPGLHTVRLSFGPSTRDRAYWRLLRVVSNPVLIEILPAEADKRGWGEAVAGMQCGLRADKRFWKADETPRFQAVARNVGRGPWRLPRPSELFYLKVGSKIWRWKGTLSDRPADLKPGEVLDKTTILLSEDWVGAYGSDLRLKLSPGKHTIQLVMFVSDPVPPEATPGTIPIPRQLRIESNVVAIEVLPKGERPGTVDDEGDAATNLQAELHELWRQRDQGLAGAEAFGKRLLEKYTEREEKSLVYYQLAEIYAQSGQADPNKIVEFAREGWWHLNDPVKKARLFVYWGDALQLTKGREDAARIYLRGLRFCLQFGLPKDKPERPTVGAYTVDGRPEVVKEYRRGNQLEMAAWKHATRIEELIELRQALTGQIVGLYAQEPDAFDELHALSMKYLGSGQAAQQLIAVAKAYRTNPEVAIPVITSIGGDPNPKADLGWGQASAGIRVRLRAERAKWAADETPKFKVDVRNDGSHRLLLTSAPDYWGVEVDGVWYRVTIPMLGGAKGMSFGPDKRWYNLELSLDMALGSQNENGGLELAPGRHTVRAALSKGLSEDGGPVSIRAVSNPIEIKILPVKPDVQVEAKPRLEFLAWQRSDGKDIEEYWKSDGSLVEDEKDLALLRNVRATRHVDSSHRDYRWLYLWFSHPDFDFDSSAGAARILDVSNNELEQKSGHGSSAKKPEKIHGNVGWIFQTISLGTADEYPKTCTVELDYAIGKWKTVKKEIPVDFRGGMALGSNIDLGPIGQGAEGKAFVSCVRDKEKTRDVQCSFVAVTKEGGIIKSSSRLSIGSELARQEKFTFDVPLSQVKEFTFRTRTVKTARYESVSLQPVVRTDVQVEGGFEFGPVTEVVATRSDTKPNIFIDIDTGKTYEPAEVWVVGARREKMAWVKEKGIDVAVTIHEGDMCLVGNVESVLRRSFDTDWDKTTAAEVLSNRELLEKEPGFDNIQRFRRQLPATFMFKTRQGGMGLFQIVGFTDDPYGVKVRFKMARRASNRQADVQVEGENKIDKLDIETLLTKVKKALQPTDNMRVLWQFETVEPFGVGTTKSPHTVREYIATISGFKSRLEYLQKTYTSKASKDPYDIRRVTYAFDGKQCRNLEERIKGVKTTPLGWEKPQNVTVVLLYQELFACILPLHNKDKLNEYKFDLVDSGSPGIYVIKIIGPEDGIPYQITIDGSRGFNIIKTQWFGPKNRKTLEDTTVLRQYDDGIWYPAERRRIRYYPNGTHKLEHIDKFSKLELNVKVPEETFKLEFPPGTKTWDTTLEDWVIISDTDTSGKKSDVQVEGAGERVSSFIGADLPASVQNVKFHSGSFAESSRTLIRFDIPLSDLKNLLAKSDMLPDFPDLHKNPKIQKDMDEVYKDFNIEWWKSDELESPVCAAWIKSERAKGNPKVWVVNILNICCSQVENNLMRVYISLYSHAH